MQERWAGCWRAVVIVMGRHVALGGAGVVWGLRASAGSEAALIAGDVLSRFAAGCKSEREGGNGCM
jgi:hypothetical protein